MISIINILIVIIFLFAAFTVIYSFVFAGAGLFARKIRLKTEQIYKKTIIFIPAFRDENIGLTVSHSLHQAYPSDKFDILVVADGIKEDVLDKLRQPQVKILETKFNGNVTIALREALKYCEDDYDNAVIIGSGDRMQIDFLLNMNNALASGCYAVQGCNVPLRLNNSFAILEGLCYDIHNHIFRKGQQALGFSSALSSSATGISFRYLKQIIQEINPEETLEKELELKLIDDNHRIFYLESAIVKSDKAQDSVEFIRHSAHYIIQQISNLRRHMGRGILSFIFGRTDIANKIVYYAMVPNLIMMAFLVFACAVSLLHDDTYLIHTPHWLLLTGIYIIAMIISMPARYYSFKTLLALASLPYNFILMMQAVIRLRAESRKENTEAGKVPAVNNE